MHTGEGGVACYVQMVLLYFSGSMIYICQVCNAAKTDHYQSIRYVCGGRDTNRGILQRECRGCFFSLFWCRAHSRKKCFFFLAVTYQVYLKRKHRRGRLCRKDWSSAVTQWVIPHTTGNLSLDLGSISLASIRVGLLTSVPIHNLPY